MNKCTKMPLRKRLYIHVLAAWYGFGSITLNGLTPPADDSTAADWVSGSRRGQFMMHSPYMNTYWVCDGRLRILDSPRWGTSCKIDQFTFAFEMSYFKGSMGHWSRRPGMFQTSGDVNLAKLREALKICRSSREPLTMPQLKSIASEVSVEAVNA